MTPAEVQALREACDYADRKQNPVVVVPVSVLRSIIADHDTPIVPDVARTIGEALGLTERDYISSWCRPEPGGAHLQAHGACMGTYGGSVCRCPCHSEGHDARDFNVVPGQNIYAPNNPPVTPFNPEGYTEDELAEVDRLMRRNAIPHIPTRTETDT